MSPRKSGQDFSEATEFHGAFVKLCEESDVLVIPTLMINSWLGDGRNSTRKTCEKWDAMPPAATESDGEEPGAGCAAPPPPAVRVAYDRCESGECPVAVGCRAFYVEYALVRAIFASVATFPTIVTLKIEDCCISRDIVSTLAAALAEFPGNNILDLSLDGNADVAEELPSLLQTGLKYLSLRRCGLDDSAVHLLSRELCYAPEKEQNLLVLNLNMNRIGDEGAFSLATALRTNRTLISLSLCGNRITDVGATHFAEVLHKFSLTREECINRRRNVFDRLLLARSILHKMIDDWKLRTEEESQTRIASSDSRYRFRDIKESGGEISSVSYGDFNFEEIPGKRVKSLELGAKRTSVSSRDKKRTNSTRMSSREKIRGRRKSNGHEGWNITLEPSPSEMKELKMRSESETPPDGHPFANEVAAADGMLWCDGCWSLGYLNLCYNRITELSIDKFLRAIYHREKSHSSSRYQRSLRVLIEAGNPIPSDSSKLAELECAWKNRWHKRGSVSDAPTGAGDETESFPKKK